jgi:hypothetical protein
MFSCRMPKLLVHQLTSRFQEVEKSQEIVCGIHFERRGQFCSPVVLFSHLSVSMSRITCADLFICNRHCFVIAWDCFKVIRTFRTSRKPLILTLYGGRWATSLPLLPTIATYHCYLPFLPTIATYHCYIQLLPTIATYNCYLTLLPSLPESLLGDVIPVVWSSTGILEACNAILTQLYL